MIDATTDRVLENDHRLNARRLRIDVDDEIEDIDVFRGVLRIGSPTVVDEVTERLRSSFEVRAKLVKCKARSAESGNDARQEILGHVAAAKRRNDSRVAGEQAPCPCNVADFKSDTAIAQQDFHGRLVCDDGDRFVSKRSQSAIRTGRCSRARVANSRAQSGLRVWTRSGLVSGNGLARSLHKPVVVVLEHRRAGLADLARDPLKRHVFRGMQERKIFGLVDPFKILVQAERFFFGQLDVARHPWLLVLLRPESLGGMQRGKGLRPLPILFRKTAGKSATRCSALHA
ncbi:MAG: hypothetical protein ACREPX_07965, partial [Rhodanobacteraceae bacterium]